MKKWSIITLGLILGLSVNTFTNAEELFDLTVPLKGSSIASPEVQHSALPEVYATVNAKSPACREFSIIDTKVTQEPADIQMDGDDYIGGNWKELWTVQYCGYTVDVPVKFTIEKDNTKVNVQSDF